MEITFINREERGRGALPLTGNNADLVLFDAVERAEGIAADLRREREEVEARLREARETKARLRQRDKDSSRQAVSI